jgi:KaiC/GvpD/RAD55 family RecA-like ATPase
VFLSRSTDRKRSVAGLKSVAGESARSPLGGPRVSMGNTGVDTMLDGGLVARRPYLIVGPAGTGKTTLALQFLCAGVRQGERCLLVTLEEPPNEVRANHRALSAELGKVDVFDAIPDVMRYERAPFKDIAAVRASMPFEKVSDEIRKTPELSSVEVTITALEQMLRTEVQRRAYTRIAIDSLTALQYFCMKGFDIVAGAQTFLRFLSDLRVTTVLTVESPLEDVETPERMLARGEIRLFRWELDGVMVRAVGVEKFRGSSHDIRLHPYRIGPTGLDVNLAVTISRDTREIIEAPPAIVPSPAPAAVPDLPPWTMQILTDELHDLTTVGGDIAPVRAEIEAALLSARRGESEEAEGHLTRAIALGESLPEAIDASGSSLEGEARRAVARMVERAEATRSGRPPVRIPEPPILAAQLAKILSGLPPSAPVTHFGTAPAAPAAVDAPVPPSSELPTVPPPAVPRGTRDQTHPVSEPPAPPARRWSIQVPVPAPSAPVEGPILHAGPPPSTPRRAGPPPLPRPARMPEGGRPPVASAVAPSVRSSSEGRSHLLPPASTRPAPAAIPTSVSPAVDATAPPPPEPPPAEAAPPAAAPRKRKRAAATPRKKPVAAVDETSPALLPEAATPPVEGPALLGPVVPPADGVLTGAPTEAAPPKPKRRAVRKKKAPPVLGATAGPPPETATPPSEAAPPPASDTKPPEAG